MDAKEEGHVELCLGEWMFIFPTVTTGTVMPGLMGVRRQSGVNTFQDGGILSGT